MEAVISVILPVRNGEKYIREAIDSVLAQSYPHFDLIVVDASEDATPEIVRGCADPRVAWHPQKSKGPAEAYNEALDCYASGKYLTFIHHDDRYHPDKLYEQIKMMERFADVDCVYNDIRYGDENMNFVKYDLHEEFYRRTNDLLALSLVGAGVRSGGMNMLIRREFIEKHRLRYSPDYPIICDFKHTVDMARAGANFKLLPRALYEYRMHEANYSGNYAAVEAEHARLFKAWGEGRIRAIVEGSNFSDDEKALLLGRALVRMNLFEQAEAHFKSRLESRFTPWLAFHWGLACYGRPGGAAEAGAAFEAGGKCLPHKAEFKNNLACCEYALGNRQRARALFAEAAAMSEGYFDPHYNHAHFDETGFVPRLTPFDTEGSRYAGRGAERRERTRAARPCAEGGGEDRVFRAARPCVEGGGENGEEGREFAARGRL
jgi:glycosyltransferase involved in cell wall biosynthesis